MLVNWGWNLSLCVLVGFSCLWSLVSGLGVFVLLEIFHHTHLNTPILCCTWCVTSVEVTHPRRRLALCRSASFWMWRLENASSNKDCIFLRRSKHLPLEHHTKTRKLHNPHSKGSDWTNTNKRTVPPQIRRMAAVQCSNEREPMLHIMFSSVFWQQCCEAPAAPALLLSQILGGGGGLAGMKARPREGTAQSPMRHTVGFWLSVSCRFVERLFSCILVFSRKGGGSSGWETKRDFQHKICAQNLLMHNEVWEVSARVSDYFWPANPSFISMTWLYSAPIMHDLTIVRGLNISIAWQTEDKNLQFLCR